MRIKTILDGLLKKFKPGDIFLDNRLSRISVLSDVLGLLTIAALGCVIISGGFLAFQGTTWLFFSSVSHYGRTIHFVTRQVFLTFAVAHLVSELWISAQSQRRLASLLTGIGTLSSAIGMMFTGYLLLPDTGSQWISMETRDIHSSLGIGAFFPTLHISQSDSLIMGTWSLVFGFFLIWHLNLVKTTKSVTSKL